MADIKKKKWQILPFSEVFINMYIKKNVLKKLGKECKLVFNQKIHVANKHKKTLKSTFNKGKEINLTMIIIT